MHHAEHLDGRSPSTSGDTDGVVSQSMPSESGSDDFRGSDMSFLRKSSVVQNSCRPVFLVFVLGLRLGFSLVEMSSIAA